MQMPEHAKDPKVVCMEQRVLGETKILLSRDSRDHSSTHGNISLRVRDGSKSYMLQAHL